MRMTIVYNEGIMLRLITRYFNHTKTYSNLRFILELTLVCFLAKIFFIIVFGIIYSRLHIDTSYHDNAEQQIVSAGLILAVVQVIIFASLETTISQWFTPWLISRFTKNLWVILLLSAFIFSLLHMEWLLSAAVYPIGVILTWSFLLKRKKSRWEAFYVTTSIHALHNLIALGLFVLVQ